ncbi:MAG TPA: MauE/DoxX family redox-associated membrane protein [bacterium]
MKVSIKNISWRILLATTFRVLCGAILVYASQDKLGDPEKFSKVVENYHVLPMSLIPLTAVVIPWLEFFTGICLMVGFRWRGAAFLFCALMGFYSLSLSWNLFHGVEMNCGCFSMDSTDKITWLTVSRDILFLGMGFIVLTADKTYASFEKLSSKN